MSQQFPTDPDGLGPQSGNRPDFNPAGPTPQQSAPNAQPSGYEQAQQPGFQQTGPGFERQGYQQAGPGFQQQAGPGYQQGYPQGGPDYQQQAYQRGGSGYQQQAPMQQPRTPKKKWPVVVGVLVIVVALVVAGWFAFGKELLPGDPGEDPTEETTSDTETELPDGKGELPEAEPLQAPAIFDETAAANGLTCHDESTNDLKVRGCYMQETDHLVNYRVKLTDDGAIDKLFVLVLLNDAEPSACAVELQALVEPILPELPITDGEREAFLTAVTSAADADGDTSWGDAEKGSFYTRVSEDTSTASIGRFDTEFRPDYPLSTDPTSFTQALTDLGWACEIDSPTFECEDGNLGKVTGEMSTAGLEEGEQHLTRIMVWFSNRVPDPDETRMRATYAALQATGEHGEVLAIGLRKLAEGEKRFYNSNFEFYRGDSYFDVGSVKFS